MGWLWTSTPSDELPKTTTASPKQNAPSQTETRASGFGLTEQQRVRIFGRPSAQQPSGSSKDDHTDAEVEAFLQSLEDPATAKQQQQAVKEEKVVEEEPEAIDRVRPDGSLDISLEVMYPRTMSCREALDELWYCQSLGGKFNDIYRYGAMQPCSEQLSALTFCMRTKWMTDKDRQPLVRDFYANREAQRKKEFGSSEDVWEVRDTALRKAFWRQHPDDVEQSAGSNDTK